jgi:hypothetical protein
MSRLHRPLLVLLPLSLAALLPAQGSTVVPPAYAAQAGNSPDVEPFATDRIRHVQYVDRTQLTAIPPNALLKAIAYRRTIQLTNPIMERKTAGGQQAIPSWQVRIGNFTGPVMNPPGTFPTSTTPGWTTVFSRTVDFTTNFPPLPLPTSGLPAFLVRFPFDVPVQYAGSGLGVDHFAYETISYAYPYLMDGTYSPVAGGSVVPISPTSVGCPAGQNRSEGAAPNPGGGRIDSYLFGAPAAAIATAFFGASKTNWLGIPLPLSLAGFTLPGCFVYTDLTLPVPALTTSAGIGEVHVPVPGDLALGGVTIYGQWVVNDARVNPAFPYATSDGLAYTLGKSIGTGLVQMSVVSGIGVNAQGRVGFVQPGRGPIFELSW